MTTITNPPPLDSVLPFSIEGLNVRGRIVRLHALPQELLRHHNYPAAVNHILMQAVSMCVLLGSAMKTQGRLILQTSSNGPISLLVVDYENGTDDAPCRVRACATFDKAFFEQAPNAQALGTSEREARSVGEFEGEHPQSDINLLGTGHLALTIDLGGEDTSYQGVVALDEDGLEAAANHYFAQSEQLPTRILLMSEGSENNITCGGIFIQSLPLTDAQKLLPIQANDNGDETNPLETEDWREAEARLMTLTAEELLREDITAGHLLLRLFHGHSVRVFDTIPMEAFCRCSDERIQTMLAQFPEDDRAHMIHEGKVGVTCEFCSRHYQFEPSIFA